MLWRSLESLFDFRAEDLQCFDSRKALVVRFDDRPGRVVRARPVNHLVHGLTVGRPFLPVTPVLLCDFPLRVLEFGPVGAALKRGLFV